MVDVGAHVGTSLEPFARDGWRVIAFEPDPENRAALENRVGDWPDVEIDPRAASDKSGERVAFFRSNQSTGISGLHAFDDSHSHAGEVETIRLAEALSARGVDRVDFLKIDTEGHDLLVLQGFDWETDAAPRVVVCEFEDHKTRPLGYRFDDLARFLESRGYRVLVSEWFPVTAYGARHRWRRFARYPCRLASEKAWGNLIATRDADEFAALVASAERATRTVVD